MNITVMQGTYSFYVYSLFQIIFVMLLMPFSIGCTGMLYV